MADCRDIESSLAAYVDGECPSVDRAAVEGHLQECPACQARVSCERTAHELLLRRRAGLRGCAPEALRQRCVAHCVRQRRPLLARVWMPLSVAASLVIGVGLVYLFAWGSSVETFAAQLAADHLKCFQFAPGAALSEIDAVPLSRDWATANNWPLKLPAPTPDESLELLAVRRCGSAAGRLAHVLYRWRGQPLSVYVLNGRIEDAPETLAGLDHGHAIRKLGEQEILWSRGGRTYAIVARAPIADLQVVASYVRPRIE